MEEDSIRLIDMHIHTDNSPDGHHSAMFMAETAEEKKLEAIAFTDHCEVDKYYENEYDRRTLQSYFEVSKAKAAFKGRLEVLRGIELGEPHYNPELAKKIINMQKYDVILGSLHNLRNKEDFYYWKEFSEKDVPIFMNEYFSEILKMLEWGDFDVLAHLTYPFRYIYNVCGYVEDINNYSKTVDEILKLCAEKDKALEINMGGLKYPIHLPTPTFETVKRFKDLGGKFVSVGTDSHYAERIGDGIYEAYGIAREAGFKCVAKFRERKLFEFPIV